VASRVLPVKIHDLDSEDEKLFESEVGSVMRSIDFIYCAAGVNRPLRADEENPSKNLNNTTYRNQINKVANTIKEVIFGLLKKPLQSIVPAESKTEKITEDSIAVLPFVNMSNDPEQEYFSDGISEEIINMLSQVPGLKVTGRTFSFSFKGKNVDLREIGKILNVNMVLEGSVRKASDKLRITAQLIIVENGYQKWSGKYDRKLDDIFKIQEEIAKSIVEQLEITFEVGNSESVIRNQTKNVAAYDLCLKGRQFLFKRGLNIFDAIQCFQKAIAIDPDYALAHAGLADANAILGYYGMLPTNETWPSAKRGAERALKLGSDLAESHCAKAIILHMRDWNWEEALKEWNLSIKINPSYEQARAWYASFGLQLVQGKHDQAVEQLEIALDNDPLSYYSNTIMGFTLGASGDTSEGVKYANKGIKLDTNSYLARWIAGLCYLFEEKLDKAEKELEIALNLSGRHAWALHTLLHTYVFWNKIDSAKEIYNELKVKSEQKYIQPFLLATCSAVLGYKEIALDYLI